MSNTATQYRLDTIAPGQLGYDEPATVPVPTHRDVARLAELVRHGELSGDEREQLAALLDTIGSAARVAPQLIATYPDDPARGYATAYGAWEPVERDFCRFLATVTAGLTGPVAVSR